MSFYNNKIIIGNALSDLKYINSESVNCCVTSPPYFGLRDYGVDGQIGLEYSIEEYIKKLLIVFREIKRILRSDGTLWLNIADSYAGSGKGRNSDGEFSEKAENFQKTGQINSKLLHTVKTLKRKNLMGIPWRLALALQDDGWYLRQDIIWYKPNCMPESVKDRCTRSHEYIFLLSKSSQYYFDYDAIKEPCVGYEKSYLQGSKGTLTPNTGRRKGNRKTFRGNGVYTNNQSFNNSCKTSNDSVGNAKNDTGLRNKRDVWSVATKGYNGAHFATFPPELIKPCISAGCPADGIVFDPFFGSGTTGAVARQLGRNFIGMELNPEYAKLASERTGAEIIEVKSIM